MYYYGKEKYWIFKLSRTKRQLIIDSIINDSQEFEFNYELRTDQKKELDGHVLFLYIDDHTKDYVFEFEGTIRSAKIISKEEGFFLFKIIFDNIKRIENKVNLEDVQYSLKNNKILKTPNKDLALNLNSISKVEFEAILYGDIFFSRTIFLKLYESLHYEHKLAFYKIIFNLNPYNVQLTNDHNLLLIELENYIETCILKPAKLFVESSYILKGIVDKKNLSVIGFNVKDNPVDYLEIQLEYAERFITLYNKDVFEKFKETYENFKETELEFKKVFKNIPSPVTLK